MPDRLWIVPGLRRDGERKRNAPGPGQNGPQAHFHPMRSLCLLSALLCACLAGGAAAAPCQVALAPPETEVAIRAYGMGLMPLDGTFARFHGSLTYDPAEHAACRVDLTVEVASLAMGNTAIRDNMVGPDFMDALRFPTLSYAGTCRAMGLDGMLALHGIRARTTSTSSMAVLEVSLSILPATSRPTQRVLTCIMWARPYAVRWLVKYSR